MDSNYDDIVTFGRVLHATLFWADDTPGELVLDYFEKPHKWEREYQQWLKLGGTTEKKCLDAFESWYETKDDPEEEEDAA